MMQGLSLLPYSRKVLSLNLLFDQGSGGSVWSSHIPPESVCVSFRCSGLHQVASVLETLMHNIQQQETFSIDCFNFKVMFRERSENVLSNVLSLSNNRFAKCVLVL